MVQKVMVHVTLGRFPNMVTVHLEQIVMIAEISRVGSGTATVTRSSRVGKVTYQYRGLSMITGGKDGGATHRPAKSYQHLPLELALTISRRQVEWGRVIDT